ncbi:MAG TPA: AsmA family protein [Oxalicibacterium sp.]|uniref:AsmA family protein n=1 Tax=Oxalicibacterium sp. TaxID=2766525 RepID=UPI002C0541D8|nr:AsmA family protein [Oxalicibacterium sp.]HWU98125.1 AsmA family protein [Oxalicibacterium sp.]
MRRWQKGVLWGIAGLALLLMAATFVLHALAGSDRLEQLAHDKVRQTWARELTVDDIAISMWPTPRVHATNVTISNPGWAQDKHMLQASGITVRLALLPLLTGNVVVKGLRFERVRVNLETDREGRRSWEMPKNAEQPSDIALSDLQIKDGVLTVRNADGTHKTMHLETLHAEATGDLQQVVFDARANRNGQILELDGKLRDLSALGTPGASTEGEVNAKIGQAALSASGRFPLDLAMPRYAFAASLDAQSLQQAYTFFGIDERSPVPLKASTMLQGEDRKIHVNRLKLQMGALNLDGSAQLDISDARPNFSARLQADRIDMIQTFLDAGRPPLPPKKPGELFRDKPLPWKLLARLDNATGHVDASIASLKLRSGMEVTDAVARLDFEGDRMSVPSFKGKMLDGIASGNAVLEGKKQAIDLNLKLDNTLLSRWFKETGSKTAISDGRMQVDMRIHASGTSMKDLAASTTGPIDIRIGPARVLSEKAGQAEFLLTGLLSAKDADSIDLSCISARLPFQSGVARGEGIAGARSDVSQLLTGGTVDLRSQTLDLHGRVRARSGVSLGWSSLGGNVKIVGPIKKPSWKSDEAGKIGTIARIGAAILTSGASIIVTSIWDGANPESDPCQQVFVQQGNAGKTKSAKENAAVPVD